MSCGPMSTILTPLESTALDQILARCGPTVFLRSREATADLLNNSPIENIVEHSGSSCTQARCGSLCSHSLRAGLFKN
jgi:hypothetical protein